MAVTIPLTRVADEWLRDLAHMTGSLTLADIDGATLLGERAMISGYRIPGRLSAGGGCRFYDALDGRVALNLARVDDIDLLPALFGVEVQPVDLEPAFASQHARAIVARGRMLGMAIAADDDVDATAPACSLMIAAPSAPPPRRLPRILDLSALWAGPLATHLLALAGGNVIKVESRSRPDAMRNGGDAFFALLNDGKIPVAIDLHIPSGPAKLRALISQSDIVIEAARPRALRQLGVDANAIVSVTPGLSWITITGHGADGAAANWVGFGDDCGVAGGLGVAMRRTTGRNSFVGDAIADPLSGIRAAIAAWQGWSSGKGGRYSVAMSSVVREALLVARMQDTAALDRSLVAWNDAIGTPFGEVGRRSSITALGRSASDSLSVRTGTARC